MIMVILVAHALPVPELEGVSLGQTLIVPAVGTESG